MSETNGGRWEFDQEGNVRYVPPEEDGNRSETDGSYHYSYQYTVTKNGNGGNNRKKNDDKGWRWILIVLGFVVAWPVGLVLLFLELSGKWPGDKKVQQEFRRAANAAKKAAVQARGEYTQARAQQTMEHRQQVEREAAETRARTQAERNRQQKQRPEKKSGKNQEKLEAQAHGFGNIKLLRILGGVLSGVFGFAFVMTLIEEITYFFSLSYLLRQVLPLLALCLAGLTLLGVAGSRRRKMKKFRKYLSMIGQKNQVSIHSLAKAMGITDKQTTQDLEEMLERDYFAQGYIDAARNMLVLWEGGIPDEPEPQTEEPQKPEHGEEQDETVASRTLKRIRDINDDIDNPELSRKIDRIEELTAKIFGLLEERPEKAGELKSFMNYYLPKTLKILENYAKLEEQDVDGDNIRETKQKIEAMMDKIVDGYEAQLDKLFADDALDISAELKVMESMLEKDGLTADNELKL